MTVEPTTRLTIHSQQTREEGAVDWLVALLLLVFALLAVAALAFKKHLSGMGTGDEPWPLSVKKPLTIPEQILYHRLVSALPECIVLAQVQLSRILEVNKGVPRTLWLNRISQKSADFVVCLKDSTVVAIVELDDSTHARASRRKADADKDKALTSAGVQIVRWTTKALPDEPAIRAAFTS
jgi:hypothetical protein